MISEVHSSSTGRPTAVAVDTASTNAAAARSLKSRVSRRLRRFRRKHAVALVSLAFINFVLFFPVIFMGRVLSPNDVYYKYDPWRSTRNVEAQNPIVNDPPASYLTLVSLLRDDPASFHWNRYIASGVPGFGSVGAAVLSPFVLLPALLLPLVAFYTGFVFLKLNVGFYAAYLWLRHERIGKNGAAAGAVVFAAAGSYAVWWLWQATNATTLYPFIFIAIIRMMRRQRVSLFLMTLLATSLVLSGFPAVIVYVAILATLYALFLLFRLRALPRRSDVVRAIAAVTLALMIAAPSVVAFSRFLRSTGYLEGRARAASLEPYGARNLRLFVDPFYLGDPVAHRWSSIGNVAAAADNLVEASVYLGIVSLPLILLGAFSRRLRTRSFWLATAIVLVALMFFHTPLSALVAKLPGVRYSPLTRLRVLLPLAAAALTAAGFATFQQRMRARTSRRRLRLLLPVAVTVMLALDLGFFAARFHPYLEPAVADVPTTATVRYLHAMSAPFRVAPMFDDFWPNSAELFRIEDVRSHFSSEGRYRAMLQRIDPGAWGDHGTVLQFNTLRMKFDDPFLALLNVRYVLEQPSIDILRWKVEEKSRRAPPATSEIALENGQRVSEVHVDSPNTRAIEVDVRVGSVQSGGVVRARLERPETDAIVGTVSVPARQLRETGKLYVALREPVKQDEHLLLTVESSGASVALPLAGENIATSPVESTVVPAASLPDGRVFENLTALHRYFAVWDVRRGTFDSMLRDASLDFHTTAVIDGDAASYRTLASVPPSARRVRFRVERYDGASQRVVTDSAVPFFFAASEKRSPDLRVRVDGNVVTPVVTNGLFVGLPLAAGHHVVELERRIARGTWPLSVAGLLLFGGASWFDRRRARP